MIFVIVLVEYHEWSPYNFNFNGQLSSVSAILKDYKNKLKL